VWMRASPLPTHKAVISELTFGPLDVGVTTSAAALPPPPFGTLNRRLVLNGLGVGFQVPGMLSNESTK